MACIGTHSQRNLISWQGSEGLSWDSGLATCQYEVLLPSWGSRAMGRALSCESETRLAFLLTSWVTLWKSSLSSKVGVKSYSPPYLLPTSVSQLWLTLCDRMDCSTPGFPVHHQLLELAHTHVHWVSDAIQPSHPLSSLLLPSIFPSIRVFPNESVICIKWPTYWSFSFSISLSNERSGLVSFRIDWFDLAVQGTLKSLLQHQFKSINSLTLSFLYSPTLTYIHNYWKNHNFD